MNKNNKTYILAITIISVVFILFAALTLSKPGTITPTGLVIGGTIVKGFDWGIIYDENSEITFYLDQNPISLRVGGTITGGNQSKIYIVDGEQKRLILSSSCIKEDFTQKEKLQKEFENLPNIENTNQDTPLKINLTYEKNTKWDSDDDGFASSMDAIDYTVTPTTFDINVTESKLCTLWEVYNLESGDSLRECYGSTECCALYTMSPKQSSNWDDIYYLSAGSQDAGDQNVVSAQVSFANIQLSTDEPVYEVYYSTWSSLPGYFYTPEFTFTKRCTERETFSPTVNQTLYLEIAEGEKLNLEEIEYVGFKEMSITDPTTKDRNISIKLMDREAIITGEYDLLGKAGDYSLEFSANLVGFNPSAEYFIKGLEALPNNIEVKVDYSNDNFFKTPVYAVKQNLKFYEAKYVLPVTGEVNTILVCDDFNFEAFGCTSWSPIDREFTYDGEVIEFKAYDNRVYGAGYSIIPISNQIDEIGNIKFTGSNHLGVTINKQRTIQLGNYFKSPKLISFTTQGSENIESLVEGTLLTLTPRPNFLGQEEIQVTAFSDGKELEKKFYITVGASKPPKQVKKIPNLAWDSIVYTAENTALLTKTIDLNNHFTDPEQDDLFFTVKNSPVGFNTQIDGSILSFTVNKDYTKQEDVIITVSDGVTTIESNPFILAVWKTQISSVPGLKKLF